MKAFGAHAILYGICGIYTYNIQTKAIKRHKAAMKPGKTPDQSTTTEPTTKSIIKDTW